VQVLDRQEAGRKSFESQQKQIEAKLKEEAYTARAKEAIQGIRDATVIKTVFDTAEPEAPTEDKIEKVSSIEERPVRSIEQADSNGEPAAKASVSRASVTEDQPAGKSPRKSMFRP